MERKTINITLVSLAILAILIVGYSFISGSPILSSYDTCHGGSVSSIDDVQIKTSTDLGGKQVVRVIFKSIETGECLDIEAKEDDMQDFLGDGFEVTDPIVGDIDLIRTQQIFNLKKDTSDKFFRLVEENVGNEFSCSEGDCPSKEDATLLEVYLYEEGFWNIDDCICVYASEEGVGGKISGGSTLEWETEISIGSSSITLSNSKLSGKIGNFAFARWDGNTMGNKVLDNPDYDLFFDYTTNDFSMIKEGTHGEVEDDYYTTVKLLERTASNRDGEQKHKDIEAYNSFLDESIKNVLSDYIDDESLVGGAEFNYDTRLKENQLIVDAATDLFYPEFILDIEATRVGIFKTIGEPEVECPNKISIYSGDTKYVYAEIQNAGSSSGSFGYSIDCNDGSQEGTPDSPVSISKGSTKKIKIEVGNTVSSGTENARCKFTAYEINSGEEDSCNFNYDSTYVDSCTNGVKSCEAGNSELWTCLSGGGYDKIDCEYGCESYENTFRCKKQGEICDDGRDNDGNGLIDKEDPACINSGWFDGIKDWFGKLFDGFFGFFTTLKWAIIVIFSLVAVFVSADILTEIKSLKDIPAAKWLLSAIIGLGIGLVLYTFIGGKWFWIMLIVGAVYLMYGKPIIRALGITGR